MLATQRFLSPRAAGRVHGIGGSLKRAAGKRSAGRRLLLEHLEERTLLTAIPAPAGLISWWPGDGHAADIAGSNDGTSMNGATYAAGKVGQAFKLDGVNDYVRIPHNSVLNPTAGMTIEAWINSSSTTGARVIASKWNDNTQDESYVFKDHNYSDKLRFELSANLNNDLADVSGTASIALGTWIHVAATYDTNFVRVYFNGVEDGAREVDPNRRIDDSLSNLLIGAVYTGGGVKENFAGLIDEVSLYNRALTPPRSSPSPRRGPTASTWRCG